MKRIVTNCENKQEPRKDSTFREYEDDVNLFRVRVQCFFNSYRLELIKHPNSHINPYSAKLEEIGVEENMSLSWDDSTDI